MKLDINSLKENPATLQAYQQEMLDDERNGNFTHDHDVVDPNSYFPVTADFPYLRKGLVWWVKSLVCNWIVKAYTRKINRHLTNLRIVGRENLRGIKGAIITCNHISKVDSFAVRAAVKKMMYVAAEHNNWRGYMGDLARNTGYIPLPGQLSLSLMRQFNGAIKYYLRKGKRILIYPEQAMWREYPKPRPLQIGAFHYAAVNNVPIVPLFITLKPKTEPIDAQGLANYADYTLHILPPIYPDANLSVKDNEIRLREANYAAWCELYEKVYQTKLVYDGSKAL